MRGGGGRQILALAASRFLVSSSPSPSSLAAATLLTIRSSSSITAPSSAVADNARELAASARHYGRCYFELSKARLSMLVVATSGTGYILGSGNIIDVAGLCYTCAGTMMVAASANSLNQIFEKHNDALMRRTRQRPLPSGRIAVSHATTWASTVGIAGTTLLAWKTNSLAAGLAASNLALYAFLYTPLKQLHPINTWVGAIVGAIPPLLGWAAASGEVSLNGLLLPAALYFWQIPHFMALAYLCRNDYAAGGFRMFSLTDSCGRRTALVSLRNCLYLLPLGYFAYDWGIASKWVFLESSVFTMCMTAAAVLFVHERTTKNARRMFHASLIYLPVFMTGLLLHRLPNEQKKDSVMINRKKLSVHELNWEADSYMQSNDANEYDEKDWQSNETEDRFAVRTRPPVAYASIAPFPFLPVPLYVPPDS